MHCCLAVCARAKVLVAPSASRALSLPILKDRGAAKSTPMTANDRLVHFMAQLAFRSKKIDMFGATSQIVIYVPVVRDQRLHCLMG
jgi:hypothetical protein